MGILLQDVRIHLVKVQEGSVALNKYHGISTYKFLCYREGKKSRIYIWKTVYTMCIF